MNAKQRRKYRRSGVRIKPTGQNGIGELWVNGKRVGVIIGVKLKVKQK